VSVGGKQIDEQLAVDDEDKVNWPLSADGKQDVKGLAEDDDVGDRVEELLADVDDKLLAVYDELVTVDDDIEVRAHASRWQQPS